MARKAGVISIDIDAGTAKFLVDMDKANAKLAQFGQKATESGHQTVTSMQASSAAIRLLENPMGNNVRAVERFISMLPGMGRALQVAFPVVGALAFGDLLTKMGTDAYEFFQKIEQAPARITKAFRELNEPLHLANDELALSNQRLENEIAKLEGKHQNGAAEALLEAKVAADKLADALDSDLSKLNKLLSGETHGAIAGLFLGQLKTSDIRGDMEKFQLDVLGANGDPAKLLPLYKSKIESYQQQAHDTSDTYGLSGLMGEERHTDIAQTLQFLQNEYDRIGLEQKNAQLTGKKTVDEAGAASRKKAQEVALDLQNKLTAAAAAQADAMERITIEEQQEMNHLQEIGQATKANLETVRETADIKRATETKKQLDEYNKALDEFTAKWQKLDIEANGALSRMNEGSVADGLKAMEEHAKTLVEWAKEYNRITADTQKEQVRHGVAMARANGNPNDPLGTLQAEQAVERAAIEKQYADQMARATNDQERSLAIRERELELQKLENEYLERAVELRHKTAGDFFREMQGQAATAGDIEYRALHEAFDRVSEDLTKDVTGDHKNAHWGRDMQEIGRSMVQDAIRSAMQRSLGHLTHKPTGNPGDPVHVLVDNLPGGPTNANAQPGLKQGASKGSFPLGKAGGIFGGYLGNMIYSLLGASDGGGGGTPDVTSSIDYGGAMAFGGDVSPGYIYGVNDGAGREFFAPEVAGRVIPPGQMGGGDTHNYYIDAAPGVSKAEMYQAVLAAHKASVATGVQANVELQKRTPQRS